MKRQFQHHHQLSICDNYQSNCLFLNKNGSSTATTKSKNKIFLIYFTIIAFSTITTLLQVVLSNNKTQKDVEIIDDASRLRLRLDYTNLERISYVAKLIENMQSDCSTKKSIQLLFKHRNVAGLGSDLHQYSTALCNALEYNGTGRLRTMGTWIFNDIKLCEEQKRLQLRNNTTLSYYDSPMACYFPQIEPVCTRDSIRGRQPIQIQVADKYGFIDLDNRTCPLTTKLYGTPTIRAASTEYLFTRVSPLVVKEAERQLNQLFYNNPKTNYTIPNNLITVHIRWGDKHVEMGLLSIDHYINGIKQIIHQRTKNSMNINGMDANTDVHILLCTEDPKAVHQFMKLKPRNWNVHLDRYYIEMLPHRQGDVLHGNVQHSYVLKGRNGLVALGSLLVAMEANDYVLTTGSNWSRLMNEIRKNIINPRCDNCTSMIDLLPGEW